MGVVNLKFVWMLYYIIVNFWGIVWKRFRGYEIIILGIVIVCCVGVLFRVS